MAELSEAIIGKLIAMAESFQDVKQQVQQASQDSQQAVQAAKQIEQVVGALQSDFASRMVTKDDIDVKADESMRSDTALGFGGRVLKHNVYDLGLASEIVQARIEAGKHQANLNQVTVKLLSGAVDHFLEGQHINTRYNNAKWQQELRHSDISCENQWEDEKELAGSISALEAAKSVQVPPAAVEEK